MKAVSKQLKWRVPQNLGWLDRILRFIFGSTVLAVFVTIVVVYSDPVWLSVGRRAPDWSYYLPLFSIYFFLTAILGADPVYLLMKISSCGKRERNPCGTFPYEIDAAIGHHPIPDSNIEHSLARSHHEKTQSK